MPSVRAQPPVRILPPLPPEPQSTEAKPRHLGLTSVHDPGWAASWSPPLPSGPPKAQVGVRTSLRTPTSGFFPPTCLALSAMHWERKNQTWLARCMRWSRCCWHFQQHMVVWGPRSSEVCRLYNERHCNFRNCKYWHVCHWCSGAHAQGTVERGRTRPMRSEAGRRPDGGAVPPY